jgi:glycosyltransferase involved in cell wall biosynthesis
MSDHQLPSASSRTSASSRNGPFAGADIVIADTTSQYDGRDLETRPLGGTESSVIRLSRELARRGHRVTVYTNCDGPTEWQGVRWRSLKSPAPVTCDLYIAVQHPHLLNFVRKPKRRAIWVVWQPNHLKHYKHGWWRMWRYRPIPILISLHQVRIYPPTLPRRSPHIVIPHGLPEDVRGRPPLPTPPPRRALFASNPQRGLRELIEIWARAILPRIPDAVLDVYGINGLQAGESAWQKWERDVLPAGMSPAVKASVQIHRTVTRPELIEVMRQSRVMLYLGHKVEAFCLSLAEAQALGLPAVVAPVAAVPERVVDGLTGYHHAEPDRFADAAVALLTDDELWRKQHEAAVRYQQGISWAECAGRFEALLLSDFIPAKPLMLEQFA